MKAKILMSMKGSYQILPLKAHTILLISIFILAQSGLASNQALIVGGAGGDKSFYDRFWKATSSFYNLLVQRYSYYPDQITFLFEDNGEDPAIVDGKSTKLNIENALGQIANNINESDRFTMFWVGHASKSDTNLRLNLPGRDLSLPVCTQLINNIIAKEMVLIFDFPFSGLIIPLLERENRLVVTSCTARERHARSRFSNLFIETLESKLPTISLMDVFTATQDLVKTWYENDGAYQSEHPQISSSGLMISLGDAATTLQLVGAPGEDRIDNIIKNARNQEYPPGLMAVVLWESDTFDVNEDSSYEHRRRRIVQILNKDGEKFGTVSIPYTRNNDDITIHHAWTLQMNEDKINLDDSSITKDLVPPEAVEAGMFVDARLQQFTMPEMSERCVIDYEYSSRARDHLLRGDFWNQIYFQAEVPIKNYRLIVKIPSKKRLHYAIHGPNIEPSIVETKHSRTYTFESADIPALYKEPLMPAIKDVAYSISLSSLDSWDRLIKWYLTLIREQDQATPEIEEKTKMLVSGAFTQEEKIKRLYQFVAANIRYVAIELGIWAIKPHTASRILEEGYGDCKDKSTLLRTMLAVAGIKSYPVLISAGESRRIVREIPSLSYFNHMILAVEEDGNGDLIWLDPTAETCAYGDLPSGDQDRWTLVLDLSANNSSKDRESYRFLKSPAATADRNLKRIKTEIRVAGDLSIKVSQEITLTGDFNTRVRNRLKHSDHQVFLREFINFNDRAELIRFDTSNLSEVSPQFKIWLEWNCADYVFAIGRQFVLNFPFVDLPYAELVGNDQRVNPVLLGEAATFEEDISLSLAHQFQIESFPDDLQIRNQIGALNVSVSKQRRSASIKRTIQFDNSMIPANQFSKMIAILKAASGKENTRALLSKNMGK